MNTLDYSQFGRKADRVRFSGGYYDLESLELMVDFHRELMGVLDTLPALTMSIYDPNTIAFADTLALATPRTEPLMLSTWRGITRHKLPGELIRAMNELNQAATVARVEEGGVFVKPNADPELGERVFRMLEGELDTVGMRFIFRDPHRIGSLAHRFLDEFGCTESDGQKTQSTAYIISVGVPFSRSSNEQKAYQELMQPIFN